MVIIAWCVRCVRCAGEEQLSVLPAAELAARLAEAYRLIGELTTRNERLAGRVEQLERQARKDSLHVVQAPVLGQPVQEEGQGPVAA